jgi:hypothetical protein
LVKVPALEESVHFRLRSSALSFDRFANDYAVSKQFAPEPSSSPLGFCRRARVACWARQSQRSASALSGTD